MTLKGKQKQLPQSFDLHVPLQQQFASIELPGPIHDLSRALEALGGLPHLSKALTRQPLPDLATTSTSTTATTPSNPADTVELKLYTSAKGVYSHPIPSTTFSSGNIVLKLVRRRRKRPRTDQNGQITETGMYTIEPLGMSNQNIRFRAIADFQVAVDQQDPIIEMANAVRAMDVNAIQNYRFPAPDEDFDDGLFLPPPVFARHNVPLKYEYKPVANTVPVTSIRPSGQETSRLANQSRYKPKPTTSISFATRQVPVRPNEELYKSVGRRTHDVLELKLLGLLDKRPMWTRQALLNQLNTEELRVIQNQKVAIPMVSYLFNDGPFKDLVIKFGFDPRISPDSRFYQHITLRNLQNVRNKASITAFKSKSTSNETSGSGSTTHQASHLFNGLMIQSPVANFQLLDISDPLLYTLIHSPKALNSTCSAEGEGWYKKPYFEQIRAVLKRKFVGLLNGAVVDDEACRDLLGDPEGRFGGSTTGPAASGASSGMAHGKKRGDSHDSATAEAEDPTSVGSAGAAGGRKTVTAARWSGKRDGGKVRVRAKDQTETEVERAVRLRKKIGLNEADVLGTPEAIAGSSIAKEKRGKGKQKAGDDDDDDDEGTAEETPSASGSGSGHDEE